MVPKPWTWSGEGWKEEGAVQYEEGRPLDLLDGIIPVAVIKCQDLGDAGVT